jgi:hypothetical protein
MQGNTFFEYLFVLNKWIKVSEISFSDNTSFGTKLIQIFACPYLKLLFGWV